LEISIQVYGKKKEERKKKISLRSKFRGTKIIMRKSNSCHY